MALSLAAALGQGGIQSSSEVPASAEEDDEEQSGPCAAWLGAEGNPRARFVKKRLLQRGDNREAWVVADRKDGNRLRVAKVLSSTDMSMKDVRYAYSEIRCLSLLQHPFIIEYVTDFKSDGKLLIFMEYASLGDLQTRVLSNPVASQDERLKMSLFCQICVALSYVHRNRMLHRDLKPTNVFISEHDIVKLGDFGYSKLCTETVSAPVAGTFCGTPCYAAPELWLPPHKYGMKADLWSLGVIMFELLTNTRPFTARSLAELQTVVTTGNPPPFRPECPRQLSQVCLGFLVKDASKRLSLQDFFKMPAGEQLMQALEDDMRALPLLDGTTNSAILEAIKDARTPQAAPQPTFSTADGNTTVSVLKGVFERGVTIWKPAEFVLSRETLSITCDGKTETYPVADIVKACPTAPQQTGKHHTFGIFISGLVPIWLKASTKEDMNKCLDDVLAGIEQPSA